MDKEEIEKAYTEYDSWYKQRKNEVCYRLVEIRNNCPDDTYSRWLLDTINFIQEEKR